MRFAATWAVLLFCVPAGAATLTYRDWRPVDRDRSVAGLSGIAAGREGRYYVVADNSDRVYPTFIELADDGAIKLVELQRPWKMPKRGDYEGVAFSRSHDSLFISDETPAVTEHLLPGMRAIRSVPVPDIFKGVERNQGFEALTISPDGETLWTANERALIADGNPRTPATPIGAVTRVRLQRFKVTAADAKPAGQFEYVTSGVHDWAGQVGLCDLVALPDGQLLALERSAAQNFSGVGSIRTRIFLVDVRGAEDISAVDSLKDRPAAGVRKTLLFDGFVCGERGMNLEGLCLGPPLAGDKWAILGVVDSTDGPLGLSKSAVVSFVLNPSAAAPPPAPDTRLAPTGAPPPAASQPAPLGR